MNNIDLIERCTGCGVCAYICPTSAISMTRDKLGFLTPSIDESKCINCGKCLKNCHTKKAIPSAQWKSVYCGWHLDDQVRKSSSSGGAYSALAESVLNDGGIVFAHTFCQDDHYTKCIKIENKDDIAKTRTSKYVESNIPDIIGDIDDALKNDMKVLFVGTPCQVSAIKNLFNSYNNLITVSFLCHGVASPEIFRMYLSELTAKNGNISMINFRDKTWGWHDAALRITYDSGKNKVKHYSVDPFLYLYYCTDIMLRNSCYRCQYHKGHNSDLTICDYSNVIYDQENINDDRGISQIIVNTKHGNDLLMGIGDKFELIKLEDIACRKLFFNSENNDISKNILNREEFFNSVNKHGFIKATKIFRKKDWLICKVKVAAKTIYRLISPIKWGEQ